MIKSKVNLNKKSYVPYRDQIYEKLKAKILSNVLAPGTIVTENELAQMFGTSRTPIREAIRHLQSEGLIEVIPKKGMLISRMNPDEVAKINELREIIHCHAIAKGILNVTQADLNRIEKILNKAEDLLKGKDNAAKLAPLSIQFHQCILKMAGNDLFLAVDQYIGTQIKRYMVDLFSFEEGASTSWRHHREVAEAIKQQDARLACQKMQEHIRWGTSFIREHISI
ncbi:DNA-binding transcriptional regulator, GntR family [Syntrophus gentianae]|uniref:DNA-binding transcriptional regulator, GntR family n=1 Tax=Syntrophus gentianae TaxID=43775 RepID=A0A1H7WRA7_9BACT|nr:GntR family transcriptional regulator [Syntrophus gentianae]SEM24110.1 DNA-binding transcriptional regulator, GntR family [Syntrophus gentianae]